MSGVHTVGVTMHEGQIELSTDDVAALIREQFPHWADHPIRAVESHGTVNALFRIGDDLVARFLLVPSTFEEAEAEVAGEFEAAQRLSGLTRFATPEPVALGRPGATYGYPWAVYTWLAGTIASHADVSCSTEFARDAAEFVRAVRALPTEGRVFTGTHRGGDLMAHDAYVQRGLDRSRDLIDTDALDVLWSRLGALPRRDPDTWCHNDLMPGNLLAAGGRLAGVLDVGTLAVADPAVDLQPAWNLMNPVARQAFREALDVDDLTWDRGRAWSFAQAIGCLWYYRETNPVMSETARVTLQALIDDAA